MPNRLLRDGICTSDAINLLTGDEEVFFYRLLVVSDDFGHMDGRPAILKASCFPLRESATVKAIGGWLDGLAGKGLIRRYTHTGKPYLAMLKWEQRVRTHAKFPLPDVEGSVWIDNSLPQSADKLLSACVQGADTLRTGVGLGVGVGVGLGKGKHTSAAPRAKSEMPENWKPRPETLKSLSEEIKADASAYIPGFSDYCKAHGKAYKDFDAAFRNCVRQDWPKLRQVNGKPVSLLPPVDKKCVCGASLRLGSTDGLCNACWRKKTYGVAEARA